MKSLSRYLSEPLSLETDVLDMQHFFQASCDHTCPSYTIRSVRAKIITPFGPGDISHEMLKKVTSINSG